MSEYKLKTGKVGDAVMGAYKKVEGAFVDTFLEKGEGEDAELHMKTGKIGHAVVGTYKKIENAFIDTFLERVDSPGDAPEPAAGDGDGKK